MEVDTSAVKKSSKSFSLRKISFGRSRAYLFEYGLLLVLVIALINILGMMFQELIGKQASFIQNGFFLPFFSYGYGDMTVGLLSAFLVVFPAVVVLIQRTASAELVDAEIKNLSWRKGLLNIFLVVASLWAITGLVSVLTAGLSYLNLNGVTGASFDWREALENISKAILLFLAVWAFSTDYRNVVGAKTSKVMHIFRYSIVGLSIIAGALFIIFPFMANRNQAVDTQISNDLFSLQAGINNKFYERSELPASLSDITLDDKVKERVSKHGYVYEKISDDKYKLCANFLTKSDGQFGAYPAGGPELSIYPPFNGDFFTHPKGQKCFDQSVVGSNPHEKPLASEPAPINTMEKDLNNLEAIDYGGDATSLEL